MDDPVVQPAPKQPNKGWFQPDDPWINRRGRPRGAVAAAAEAQKRQPLAGKLNTLFVPLGDLHQFLAGRKHPWQINLPRDVEIVSSHLDSERNGVLFTIHSDQFADVQVGEPIPDFKGAY